MGKPIVVNQEGLRIMVDPDDPARIPKPIIEYKLTKEEIGKRYGHIKGTGKAPPVLPFTQEEYMKRKEKKGENEMTRGKKLNVETEDILKICREYGTGKAAWTAIADKFGMLSTAARNLIDNRGIRKLLAEEKAAKQAEIATVIKEAVEEERRAASEPVETEEYPDITEAAANAKQEVDDAAREAAEKIIQKVEEIIETVPDPVNHPAHYTAGAIEVIDFIQDKLTSEEFEGFCKGVIMQYVCRCRLKGGIEDLKKARWYLDKIIAIKEAV